MSADWPEYPLLDVYSVTNGLNKNRSEFGFGHPFLTFKEVFYNYFVPDELISLANTTPKERDKCSVQAGDVFITRTSETFEELGISCVALKDYPNAAFNGFCKRLRPKGTVDVDPKYSAFFFKGPEFRQQVLSLTNMSTRASLNNDMLKRLTIKLPSLQVQQRVAKVLSDLHDKIQLNHQINQTLEQTAQAIFKSWFVDFEPVKAKRAARKRWNALQPGNESASPACYAGELEGQPFDVDLETYMNLAAMQAISGKDAGQLAHLQTEQPEQYAELRATAELFPSAMQDSELGEIPAGWQCLALDAIAKYQNGLALQKFRPESEDDYLPVVKIAQLKKGFADGEEKASPNIKPECIIDNGDVVFSWSGSLMVDTWCGGKAALNQHLFKVTSKAYPKWLYYQLTKHHLEEFQRIAAAKAVTMGHIKREHLKAALCATPDANVIDAAGKLLGNLLDKQIELRLESNNLSQLRDTLLPKFLSGELTLPDTEEPLAELLDVAHA